MSHQDLIDKAEAAATALFNDMSVEKCGTIGDLNELIEFIKVMTDTLGE